MNPLAQELRSYASCDGLSELTDLLKMAAKVVDQHDALLAAVESIPMPPVADEVLLLLQRIVAETRVGIAGNKPVMRSGRINCPADVYHDAKAILAKMEASRDDA